MYDTQNTEYQLNTKHVVLKIGKSCLSRQHFNDRLICRKARSNICVAKTIFSFILTRGEKMDH